MGRDLYDAYPTARALFERADSVLGRDISRICFEGSDEELGRTDNSQPAIFTVSMACLEVARETGALAAEPAFVAGHSMGEYTALAAAGALSFEDGLRLVERRGQLTQAAAEKTPGGMAAILGLEEPIVREVCADSGAELCNLNAPGQIVIGGRLEALDRAIEAASAKGARRAIKLDVGGAFHTSLMADAAAAFAPAVSSTQMQAPRVPFVANNTAEATTDAGVIAGGLVFQLTHPVRWVECVEYLAAQGVDTVVEIGPGNVLTGLVKRIAPQMARRNISGAATVTG